MTNKPYLLIGSSNIAFNIIESLKYDSIEVLGILDDDKTKIGTEIDSIPVISHTKDEEYLNLIDLKYNYFISILDIKERKETVCSLQSFVNLQASNIIDSSSRIPNNLKIGFGNYIGPGVVVGSNVEIGDYNIINTNSIIDNHSKIGNFKLELC